MPQYTNEIDSATGNTGGINTDRERLVALNNDPAKAGAVKFYDSNGNPVLTTENGSLDVSIDSLILYEQVDGAALNTNVWLTSVDTMTIAQAGGYIALNAGSNLTTNKYSILTSIKYCPMYANLPLRVMLNAKLANTPQANTIVEMGLGLASGVSAPTDGAFYRFTSSGALQAVMNNAGAEQTAVIPITFTYNEATLFEIIIVEDLVQYLIDDVLVAEIEVPIGTAFPTNAGRLPVFARVYNSGTPAAAQILSIGQVIVTQQALNQNKSWAEVLAGLGRTAYQSPLTTFGQTANHANSTSPTSATLANTTAGYATLGGRFQFAAIAGAATDYALFAYQVPAGYQLFINQVRISLINSGIAVAITGSVFDWAIGVNASAVSLATTDNPPTSWAPRRIPLGTQGFEIADGVGEWAETLKQNFTSPLVVDGGRYVHIILQCPIGTATATEVFRGDVMIGGYFE